MNRCVAGVFLAEDDDAMCTVITQSLRENGPEFIECADTMPTLEHPVMEDTEVLNLIICDIRAPDVSWLEILKRLSAPIGFPSTILIAAFGDGSLHDQAARVGAVATFDRPSGIQGRMIAGRRALSADLARDGHHGLLVGCW
jgi:DNA-binding NtrC family response regulator